MDILLNWQNSYSLPLSRPQTSVLPQQSQHFLCTLSIPDLSEFSNVQYVFPDALYAVLVPKLILPHYYTMDSLASQLITIFLWQGHSVGQSS